MIMPVFEIDLKELQRLCQLQCSDDEIAARLGCSKKTIQRRKVDPDFREIMERGKGVGRYSLRSAQWKHAMEGNTAMLIFLGKQYLGQTDKIAQGEMDKDGNLTDATAARAKLLKGTIFESTGGDNQDEY